MNTDAPILVVEDSEIQEVMIRRILLKHGFKVVSANNGAVGLQMAEEHSPALVISDIIMPVMDGYEMCRQIKSNPRLKDIPVILLTEIEEPAGVVRGIESRADGYITKPYDADYLVEKVDFFLKTPEVLDGPPEKGIDVEYAGHHYTIYANRQRILRFLLLTYEHAIRQNAELTRTHKELAELNEQLDEKVKQRTFELTGTNAKLAAAKDSLEKLNRTLLTVSHCNQALVRATDGQQLMDDICRVLTKTGGYRMAWIGIAEHNAEKTVRPAAYSGHNEGYLETLKITWADTERGRGPTGTAIRANKPVICHDIATYPFFDVWRSEAQKRGYISSAAIPLTDGETVIGSLNIYSEKADAFNAEEMRLLTELAADLSFGIRHQRIKNELETSEKKFKGLADNALVGIVQSTLDGGILYANNALLEIFEFDSLEEFISAGALQRWKNPEDRKKMVEDLKSSGHASFEAEMLTKTGKTITILYSAVISDDKLSATVLDVTERKRAEMALWASEERLNEAQRIGKLGFLDWDLITNEIECSDETLRIYGLDAGRKKVKPEEITQLVHPDDVALAAKSLNNAIEKGVEHHIEHRIVRPDGTIIYVDTRAEIIRDANGKPIRMLGTNLDVTDRKMAEEVLRHTAEDLKATLANLEKTNAILLRQEKLASIGTLSAGVAHEILNPLNIVGTIVQLMQMDEWPAKVKENLDEIMTQIRRATKITNNLRMFARVHKREITAVDVHALFDKTATLIEHDLNLDNITVDRDYDQNLPLIFVDQDLFAQVFLNLLNNARYALQEVKDRKKSISIKTGAFADKVEIRLSNTGPRIPEEIIGRIFDPFFTTKDPDKGTGLGLSMAHTFIRDFGGTITVQNEAPEGVTFIITLPAKGEE